MEGEQAAQQQQQQEQENINDERRWFSGCSSKNCDESFYPGVHFTFNELERERTSPQRQISINCLISRRTDPNENSNWVYGVVTDPKRLERSGRSNGQTWSYSFPVANLRHATSQENAEKICRKSGFIGFPNGHRKRCTDVVYEQYNQDYVWWSTYFEPNSTERERAQDIAGRFGGDVEPSYPFQDRGQLYGRKAFCYPWGDVVNAFKEQFCFNMHSKLRFRVLGTYVYRQEIMHAVVVHCADYDGVFKNLPLIENGFTGKRVQMDDKGQMTWSPESVIMIPDNPYVSWENLSFAFHIPPFRLNDLASERHLRNLT